MAIALRTRPRSIELFPQPYTAEVVQPIAPQQRGRVKFRASFWPARLYQADERQLLPTERVSVIGRDGITLLVEPLPSSAQIA